MRAVVAHVPDTIAIRIGLIAVGAEWTIVEIVHDAVAIKVVRGGVGAAYVCVVHQDRTTTPTAAAAVVLGCAAEPGAAFAIGLRKNRQSRQQDSGHEID